MIRMVTMDTESLLCPWPRGAHIPGVAAVNRTEAPARTAYKGRAWPRRSGPQRNRRCDFCRLALGPRLASALTNGGFETGDFGGWHTTAGGAGQWQVYSGTGDLDLAPPPEGTFAAATVQDIRAPMSSSAPCG
jgi:hypothetical protein